MWAVDDEVKSYSSATFKGKTYFPDSVDQHEGELVSRSQTFLKKQIPLSISSTFPLEKADEEHIPIRLS
jgi:hypothetical protein